MIYRLKSEAVSGKFFTYENLRSGTNCQDTLLYLNLAEKNVLYKNGREGTSYGEKWLLSGSLQLPIIGMDIFERRQHYNVSCTINCQETFMILDFDVLFHVTCFSSLLFLTPQRIRSVRTHATNMPIFGAQVNSCGTTSNFFKTNVQTFYHRRQVPTT